MPIKSLQRIELCVAKINNRKNNGWLIIIEY